MRKLKTHGVWYGLIFTVAAALFIIGLSAPFFLEARLQDYLWQVGIDCFGGLICAALYYGCIRQESAGIKAFRFLIILVCFSFVINELIWYTVLVPEYRMFCFTVCLLSKLTDLGMIYFFYHYVKKTLGFEGKLATFTAKIIPVLLVAQTIVMLINIFTPLTFTVDAAGMYRDTDIYVIEEVFLAVASVLTTVLIFLSHNPTNQKVAALTFVVLPLIEYAILGGSFAEAAQYGIILTSLIVMYCIIFNDKSSKLAATQSELNMATEIQANALPSICPDFAGKAEYELFASMNPAKEVGGDFYDFFMIDSDHLCVLIADVSGKGVPAALFMMTAKTMIKDYALTQGSTSETFTAVNARLCEGNEAGMFATAWIGVLDLRTMTLQYTNAGHNYPVLLRKDQPCEMIKDRHGLFLAGMEFTRYKQSEITLAPGDRILLYTDGVVEAHNRVKELYGEERLQTVLDGARNCTGEKTLERIFDDVNEFAAEVPQFDDITMVVLTIK